MEHGGARMFSGGRASGYLELALMAAIVLAGYTVQSMLPHKLIAMNVLFLPTAVAAYCLGARSGALTALFSFLIVAIYAIAAPQRFLFEGSPRLIVFDLLIWGAFLGLTSLAVGSLSDGRRQRVHELQDAYFGVLEVLAKFLESSDHYTKSHSVRVAELSVLIAEELGLSHEEIDAVRAGALLHDIGKTDVSLDLVCRASALTESNPGEVTAAPQTGASLMQSLGGVLRDAVPIIRLHHHEYGKQEGQDSPYGRELPIGARIVAVADAYDSIVTDRPYRRGRAPWQAVAEIQQCRGTRFDPEVVDALRQVLPRDVEGHERELIVFAEICDPEDFQDLRDSAELTRTAAQDAS